MLYVLNVLIEKNLWNDIFTSKFLQGKIYTFLIWTQGKSPWKQEKLWEISGKVKYNTPVNPVPVYIDMHFFINNRLKHLWGSHLPKN